MVKEYMIKAYSNLVTGVYSFMHDEDGDTNFISILIILGIVVVLAGVFLVFKDQILEMVSGKVDTFTEAYDADVVPS